MACLLLFGLQGRTYSACMDMARYILPERFARCLLKQPSPVIAIF